jgi:hypothetical protein
MDNEQLIQEFIKQFTGTKRRDVEEFLRELVNNGVRFKDAIKETKKEFNETGFAVRDLASSIQATITSLRGSNSEVKKGLNLYTKLGGYVRQIQDDQAGIYQLSLKELKTTRQKAASELRALKDISRGLRERFDRNEELTDQELNLLSAYEEELKNETYILTLLDERIKKEKRLESSLGLTGAVLDNLNKIGIRALGGIGINLGTLQDAFDEARDSSRKAAIDIDELDNADQFSDLSKRIYTLSVSLKGVAKGLAEAFNDPLSLGLGLFKTISKQVFELNTAQNNFRRLTGESAKAIGQINSRAVTSVDLLNTMSNITKEIGLQANLIFSSRQLVDIAKAQELLGLSAEQAITLGTVSRLTNQTQEDFNNSLLRGADSANKLFKSAVPPGVALEEAANASADIVLSLGMAPGRLGSAATAAKALGLELNKLSSIADGLLNFESSIQSELEAQLITGKQINLSRAREFALANDLEGVASELAANNVTAAEFADMNRIAQNSLAKALGLSREELGKTIIQQSLAGTLTDSQRASVLGVNQAQLEQLDIQKSIEKSIQSITQALAGPLEFFAQILEKTGAIQVIIGGAFAVSIGKFTLGIISALGQFKAAKTQADLLTASLLRAAGASQAIRIPVPGPLTIGGAGFTKAPFAVGSAGAGKGLLAGAGRLGVRALGALGGPAGIALATLIGSGFALRAIMKEGDDVISKPGYGDRVLLDKGTITPLYNGDTIFAASNSPTQMSTNGRRVEQLLERLIANTEKTGAVYIDGREVGTAMVMNSYKSS